MGDQGAQVLTVASGDQATGAGASYGAVALGEDAPADDTAETTEKK